MPSSRDQVAVTCENCGHTGYWSGDGALPKRIRCPSCRSVFVPSPDAHPSDPPSRTTPDSPRQTTAALPTGHAGIPTSARYPAEAWYYTYMVTVGEILRVICIMGLIAAIVIFAVGVCSTVYFTFARGGEGGAHLVEALMAWGVYLGVALVCSFASFFWSAVVLLSVDVARNIRWQRLVVEYGMELDETGRA